jgi:hypothetical protein
MGGSSSKTTSETVHKALNETVAENTMSTSNSGTGSQEINVSGNNNRVCKNKMNMSLKLMQASEFNNELAAKMQNDIDAKVKQLAESSSNMFGFAPSSSESNVKVNTDVKNLFSMKNMQKCLSDIDLRQVIKIRGSGNEVCENQFDAIGSSIVTCVGKNKGFQEAVNKTVSDIDNLAKSKNDSLLGSLLGGCPDLGLPGGSSGTCCVVISSVLLLAVAAYFVIPILLEEKGGGKGASISDSDDFDVSSLSLGDSSALDTLGAIGAGGLGASSITL